MFVFVGIVVVMGNGSDIVKVYVDYVMVINDVNGVVVVIW